MAVTDYLYPLDITGQAVTNKVLNERQTLNPPSEPLDYHFILPFAGPYFRDTMKLVHITTGRALVRGIDWMPGHKFHSASFELEGIRGGIYSSILFMDRGLSGQVQLAEYQTLGGEWTLSEQKILEVLSNRAVDPRSLTYDEVSGKPNVFPPIEHSHDVSDLTGMIELIQSNYDISASIRARDMTVEQLLAELLQALIDAKPKYTATRIITAGQFIEIDLKTILGAKYPAYDMLSASIDVRVKNLDQTSPTFNMYINSTDIATSGVNAAGIVRVVNYYTADLEFHIRIDVPRFA